MDKLAEKWDRMRVAIDCAIADGESGSLLDDFQCLRNYAEKSDFALAGLVASVDPYGTGGTQYNGQALDYAKRLLETRNAGREAWRNPSEVVITDEIRAFVEKVFNNIALRVDQYFKAKNIQGGVRCGDDIFSPMDRHELCRSIAILASKSAKEPADE